MVPCLAGLASKKVVDDDSYPLAERRVNFLSMPCGCQSAQQVWKHAPFWNYISGMRSTNLIDFLLKCFPVLKHEELHLMAYLVWSLRN